MNFELEHYEAAIADYDEALRLLPVLAKAYNNRGLVKSMIGRHQDAVGDLEMAIDLNPDYTEAYINLGEAKVSLNCIEAAKSDFQTALKLVKQQNHDLFAAAIERRIEELNVQSQES